MEKTFIPIADLSLVIPLATSTAPSPVNVQAILHHVLSAADLLAAAVLVRLAAEVVGTFTAAQIHAILHRAGGIIGFAHGQLLSCMTGARHEHGVRRTFGQGRTGVSPVEPGVEVSRSGDGVTD